MTTEAQGQQSTGADNEAQSNQTQGQTQGNASQQQNIDLSGLMSSNNPDMFDREKVTELYRNAEKWKTDRAFFQSKYQEKNNIPEKIEDYGTSFKPDSMYEKAMNMEGVKEMQKNLYKHAKENGIGKDAANAMFDFMMKTAVQSGDIDLRSEEQIAEATKQEAIKAKQQRSEILKPMLESLHRTEEENNAILDNFINSNNVFTKDPIMKKFLKDFKETAIGNKLLTLMNDTITMGNVPIVTGTIATKDKAAFEKAMQAEEDPERRQILMDDFYGKGKK